MGALQTVLTDEIDGESRRKTWLKALIAHRAEAIRFMDLRGWSERSIILLVMQRRSTTADRQR